MTSTKPTELADAAFGPTPDLWPLPDAETDTDLWLRAVAAGAQGRYSSARADLGELLRRRPGPGIEFAAQVEDAEPLDGRGHAGGLGLLRHGPLA